MREWYVTNIDTEEGLISEYTPDIELVAIRLISDSEKIKTGKIIFDEKLIYKLNAFQYVLFEFVDWQSDILFPDVLKPAILSPENYSANLKNKYDYYHLNNNVNKFQAASIPTYFFLASKKNEELSTIFDSFALTNKGLFIEKDIFDAINSKPIFPLPFPLQKKEVNDKHYFSSAEDSLYFYGRNILREKFGNTEPWHGIFDDNKYHVLSEYFEISKELVQNIHETASILKNEGISLVRKLDEPSATDLKYVNKLNSFKEQLNGSEYLKISLEQFMK